MWQCSNPNCKRIFKSGINASPSRKCPDCGQNQPFRYDDENQHEKLLPENLCVECGCIIDLHADYIKDEAKTIMKDKQLCFACALEELIE